jgi:hypothetical protein
LAAAKQQLNIPINEAQAPLISAAAQVRSRHARQLGRDRPRHGDRLYRGARPHAHPGTTIRSVEGVTLVRVKLVFTPPWAPHRISEEAKLDLGLL